MSDESMLYARSKNEQALAAILNAKESDNYSPYNLDGVQTIELSDLY